MSVIADILEAQENVSKVYQAGYEEGTKSGANGQIVANALIGKVSGEGSVYIDDISPIEHTLDVKVRSKNSFRVLKNFSIGGGGITISGESNNSFVTINGTLTAENGISSPDCNVTLKAGTYSISVHGLNIVGSALDRIYVRDANTSKAITNNVMSNAPKTFTLEKETTINFLFVFGANSSYSNAQIQIQVEESASASAYAPYVNVGDYSVDTDSGSYPINDDGTVDGVKSGYPTMYVESIVVDGMVVDVGYNKDANKVVASLEERIAALEAAIVSK